MLAILSIYVPLMFIFEVSEEIWNCSNPRPYPKSKHYVCEWDESDLMKYKGKWLLRPRDMHDNYFEDKVRKSYWEKRGYDATKIRFK
jgi:hypothetical protein